MIKLILRNKIVPSEIIHLHHTQLMMQQKTEAGEREREREREWKREVGSWRWLCSLAYIARREAREEERGRGGREQEEIIVIALAYGLILCVPTRKMKREVREKNIERGRRNLRGGWEKIERKEREEWREKEMEEREKKDYLYILLHWFTECRNLEKREEWKREQEGKKFFSRERGICVGHWHNK